MPVFNYECINKQGEVVKGQLTADTLSNSASRLKEMGLVVINIKQVKQNNSTFLKKEKKVTLGDLSIFSRQFSAMLSAGIPITKALFTLSKQTENNTFKHALESISQNVEDGMNLTDAFRAYPSIFPAIYISMIEAGELGGMLETALNRLSDQLLKEKQLQDNVNSATFYPKMVLGFALIIFVAMLIYLVPVFQTFVPDGTPIPGITRLIFNMSASVRSNWLIWLLSVGAVVTAVMALFKSDLGKNAWERVKLNIPIFGKLIQKTVIARFSRTLATLLAGGIPVVQALQSAGPTSGSLLLANVVDESTRRIEEGRNISTPLEESGLFPPMVTQMIAVGEETGQLSELLDQIASFYEEEVGVMTKGLSSLIEPLMLMLVGVVVGGMLISLYLPIFTSITASY